MTHDELTAPPGAATSSPVKARGAGVTGRQSKEKRRAMMAAAAIPMGLLAACVNVAAPEKPIVIELNINIRQEVIYRLAADAANTVEENQDIF